MSSTIGNNNSKSSAPGDATRSKRSRDDESEILDTNKRSRPMDHNDDDNNGLPGSGHLKGRFCCKRCFQLLDGA
jgi:hypothetical protein